MIKEKIFMLLEKIPRFYGKRRELFDFLIALLITATIIFINQAMVFEICNLKTHLIGTIVSFLGVILALSLMVSSFLFIYFPKNPRLMENFRASLKYKLVVRAFLEVIFFLIVLIILLVIELKGICTLMLSGTIFFFIIFALLRFFKFLFNLSAIDKMMH